ncbi:MAG: UvrB/UvrC motif-containing protein, partial [Actinomycetota bacterium]
NRRSRFQEKAIWIKLSDEPYPRLTQVRGASSLRDEHGWSGPFNGRDEAERAIEALHEVFPIRQCKPRITLTSMKHASPCALLDLGKCGAPCVGLQSLDSYLSIASDLKFAMLIDSREMLTNLRERMHTLSIQERFEEAAEVRNRLGAYIRGTARGERIRSLTKVEEIVALTRSGKNIELVLIRYGRLAASLLSSQDQLDEALTAIRLTGEIVPASEKVLPASTHEEVEVLLRYLEQDGIELLEIKGEWARASFGAGYARSQLEDLKVLNEKNRYKEDFASSFERSRQR